MALKGLNLLTNKFMSSRSRLTCTYKCGNACFGDCGNHSDNPYFGDMMSRRSVLKAGGLTVLTVGGGAALAACSTSDEIAAAGADGTATTGQVGTTPVQGMRFTPVEMNNDDQITLPEGYEHSVLIAWGDPVYEDAPEFDVDNQSAEAAARQFGFNNDFGGLFEHPEDPARMVFVASHEYTTEPQMHPGYDEDNPTDEQINIGLAAHGHTILEVSKVEGSGELKREFGPLNRRITATTPFRFTGPAAGSDLLKTSADPAGTTVLGTLNNCAGGLTPWGTYLSGEENINQYFANSADLTGRAKEDAERIGAPEGASGRQWERLHERFDMSKEPNEFLRFGYIVEIDPFDPESTPVKHTAMGRFKHEAGNIYVTDDGTVVCYSGDDERFEYIYKFVSNKQIIEGDKAHNMSILDSGTLYVASLEGNSPADQIDGSGQLPSDGAFDGTGTWHPLVTVETDGRRVERILVKADEPEPEEDTPQKK